MSNTNDLPALTLAAQTATGSGIAQVLGSGSAIVNYYALARPRPVSASELAETRAQLETLPLDGLPAPAPLPPGSRMPFGRNPLFVGRADELRQLARLLKRGGTAAIGPVSATAATTGLGGIGKTQLAVEFVHRYGQYFSGGVFWISLAGRESVPAEVAQCGGAGGLNLRADFGNLKLDEQVAAVLAE